MPAGVAHTPASVSKYSSKKGGRALHKEYSVNIGSKHN
jgi:hypothetical protein